MRLSPKMTGIPPEKSFKTLVARGDKTGIMVSCNSGKSRSGFKKKLAKGFRVTKKVG